MALLTKSQFYYGIEIEVDNDTIDISEGAGEINVTIPIGVYSPKELTEKIEEKLNEAGTKSYTVSFNRTTRKITISSTSNFSILIASGTHAGSTIYANLGYTGGIDLTGAASYLAATAIGKVYQPQFYLLDYIPLEHNVKSAYISENETTVGNVEVIRYGTRRYTQFSIDLITNQKFLGDSMWTSSSTGVEDALDFMNHIIKKYKIEFMPDKSDPATFYTLILESTESDQNGMGFILNEMLDYGVGYFRTGKLNFREVIL